MQMQIPNCASIIDTERSRLYTGSMTEHEPIVTQAVEYMRPLLQHKPEIVFMGKVVHQQRNVGFFSNESVGYRYSNQIMRAQPVDSSVTDMIALVNAMCGTSFNAILANEYVDGQDYISAHSDTESALDAGQGVVAISYGATRKFRIRRISDKTIVADIPMSHLDILAMTGDFQKEFTHEIPKELRVKLPRVSLTFRKHTT